VVASPSASKQVHHHLEELTMKLYCGIDLHSNNHWLTIIDEQDRRVVERRLANDLSLTLQALKPYESVLTAIAVESTFNWYWLVDGLMEAGYQVKLVNTSAVRQYDGLKHSDPLRARREDQQRQEEGRVEQEERSAIRRRPAIQVLNRRRRCNPHGAWHNHQT
jgi:transposase